MLRKNKIELDFLYINERFIYVTDFVSWFIKERYSSINWGLKLELNRGESPSIAVVVYKHQYLQYEENLKKF